VDPPLAEEADLTQARLAEEGIMACAIPSGRGVLISITERYYFFKGFSIQKTRTLLQ
jgi:hypothetical protein